MAKKVSKRKSHTGQTASGNTRDMKVDKVGKVTIYKRGSTYYLYYREARESRRVRIDGNLSVARASAAKVAAALEESRPSPMSFQHTSPAVLIREYLDYAEHVQCLAWRTLDRYRAAISHFGEFCEHAGVTRIDLATVVVVEDFVRWLRGQSRTRNGHANGNRRKYTLSGIKFIIGTCKTAFNWGYNRRMLPPYARNPFSDFKVSSLKESEQTVEREHLFSPEQEKAFFAACNEWQKGMFLPLARLGLRAGELTHLLISDVNLDAGVLNVHSKPEMLWNVKTRRRRSLPVIGELRELFTQLIGARKSGFVLLNKRHATDGSNPARRFASDRDLRRHLTTKLNVYREANPDVPSRELRKQAMKICRTLGQVPVKRIRDEFCDVTKAIGFPEFTRAHDLRHLFASRAQAAGINPLLVQQMLGHSTLEMTQKYTHLNVDAMRKAIEQTAVTSIETTSEGDEHEHFKL